MSPANDNDTRIETVGQLRSFALRVRARLERQLASLKTAGQWYDVPDAAQLLANFNEEVRLVIDDVERENAIFIIEGALLDQAILTGDARTLVDDIVRRFSD